MRQVRVHFDNGEHVDAHINGDIDTIVNYYLDQSFTFLDGRYEGKTAKARCVEFLDRPVLYVSPSSWKRLQRIYTVSEQLMLRRGLQSKIRCTFFTPNYSLFSVRDDKQDCAYVPGMFGGI